MSVTLYNVVSSDGFIARPDGNEDFIPDALWDYFVSLFSDYDAVAISRKTYEAIQQYDPEELAKFEDTPILKIVISHDTAFKVKEGYVVAESPEAAQKLAQRLLVSSGATLNDSFLKSGLVTQIQTYELPVSLGEGIKRFHSKPPLTLVGELKTELGILRTEI